MLLDGANATAIRGAHHERAGVPSAGTASVAGGVTPQLMKSLVDEAQKLDLTHRLETVQGHADRRSDDTGLCQRGVDDAIGAELLVEALSDPEYPAVDPDIFAQNNYIRVAGHLLSKGEIERLYHGELSHGRPPCRGAERHVTPPAVP
jgi:hypothetical protein